MRTILVVDDEDLVCKVACAILKGCGCEVVSALTGSAAMELMRSHAGDICLIVLDAGMTNWPEGSTVASLLAINPNVAVVISSGSLPQEALRHFDPRRVLCFLQKPYTASQLRDAAALALQSNFLAA